MSREPWAVSDAWRCSSILSSRLTSSTRSVGSGEWTRRAQIVPLRLPRIQRSNLGNTVNACNVIRLIKVWCLISSLSSHCSRCRPRVSCSAIRRSRTHIFKKKCVSTGWGPDVLVEGYRVNGETVIRVEEEEEKRTRREKRDISMRRTKVKLWKTWMVEIDTFSPAWTVSDAMMSADSSAWRCRRCKKIVIIPTESNAG